jgi:flavin-dependent dehydrogenase
MGIDGTRMALRVVVVGAGVGGSHAGKLLAQLGVEVVLVDGSIRPPWRCDEALSSRLAELAMPPAMAGTPCVAHRAAWGASSLVERPAILRATGPDRLIDREMFDVANREAARAAGANVARCAVHRLERGFQGWRVELRGGAVLRADFVVDATGRASSLGTWLGARTLRTDALIAIRVSVDISDEAIARTTLVASTPNGWWYAGPSREGACVIYFTDADLWRAQRREDALLNKEFRHATALRDASRGRIRGVSAPRPAWSQVRVPAAGPGWYALGDAAASRDPLCSQGMFHALRMADLIATNVRSRAGVREYDLQCRLDYYSYLQERHVVYARERRWASSPFWRRRVDPRIAFEPRTTRGVIHA